MDKNKAKNRVQKRDQLEKIKKFTKEAVTVYEKTLRKLAYT